MFCNPLWFCLFFFTLLFGFSQSFALAMVWRFCLGFGNGIIGTAKTAVSELAKGNEKLETRGMGLVMGMWGWGFLICPALSGSLAEPVRQYPHIQLLQRGWIHSVLTKFPFLLPNVVGSIFCMVAFFGVSLFVEETLDSRERRSARLIGSDALAWFRRSCQSCKKWILSSRSISECTPLRRKWSYQKVVGNHDVNGNHSHTITDDSGHSRPSCIEISDHDEDDNDDCDDDAEDVDDALKESTMKHSESTSMLCVSPRMPLRKSLTRTCRNSFRALRRCSESSSASAITSYTIPPAAAPDPTSNSSTTLLALWSNERTRNHLLVYWIYSFVSIQVDEAFPLYCISQSGGLGLSEDNIGKILSGSGIIFAVLQYFVYATIVSRCGIYPSMRISSFLGAPIIALIPVSIVFFHRSVETPGEGMGNTLPWCAFIFLSIVMASYRIFTNIFFSSITVATNRTVPATHRASMNGLSMLGGSMAKACGPTFAGFLVAFCLSSGVVPQRVGGALIFLVIALLGIAVAFVSTFLLKEINDDVT